MRGTCTRAGCGRPEYARGLCTADYQRARYHGELPDAPPKTCEHCGATFTSRNRNTRYCSKAHADAARQARARADQPAAQCEGCSKPLPADRDRRMRFCSRQCREDHRNAALREARLAAKAGRICRGCQGPVPPERPAFAVYCSDECKSLARRHESYGLTKAELAVLLAQHERCAICGTDDWGRKGPQVDHCHKTGRVRGVLCGNCNPGLGRFRDDPALLRAAADYLERTTA
jgi:hypothetical protein